jgi:hypothetical protein
VVGFVQQELIFSHVPCAAAMTIVDKRFLICPHPAVEMERSAVVLIGLAYLGLEFSRSALYVDVLVW